MPVLRHVDLSRTETVSPPEQVVWVKVRKTQGSLSRPSFTSRTLSCPPVLLVRSKDEPRPCEGRKA